MIYEKMVRQRKKLGLKQKDMAAYLGISQQGYALYEKGKRKFDIETALKISSRLGMSLEELCSDNDTGDINGMIDISPVTGKRYPLAGSVACGEPLLDETNEVFEFDDMHADFALRCKGDSMTGAHIFDGDIVFIRQCPEVENGEIAAVATDSDGECTLKKVYYDREHSRMTLMPCNPDYEPIIIEGEQLNDVRILGKAVAFVSRL